MKKYFLTIIGESKIDYNVLTDIGVAMQSIVDSNYLNFNYEDSHILFHFESSVEKEDMFCFIRGILYGITDTFILTELNDDCTVSLPKSLNFIFDLENVNGIITKQKFNVDESDFDEYEDDGTISEFMEKFRQNLLKHQPKITLDMILDKINDNGLDSLNDTEKKLLEKYSK